MQSEYQITDAGGVSLLSAAADAWQRAAEARDLIDRDGPVILDRFGQKVPHPAIRIEHGARAQLLQALKQLNLDVEPLKTPGRPPGTYHIGG
jgi:hypothetical protein